MLTRRRVMQAAAAACALTGTAGRSTAAADGPEAPEVTRGRIHQSIMGWTFKPMPVEELARHCKAIGLVAMEGVPREHYPYIRQLRLKISLVGSHGFQKGPFSRANYHDCVAKLRDAIDVAVQVNCRNVITFTGMREAGTTDAQGERNCIDCWKAVIAHAEKSKVNLCLEHLSTRDHSHPMKGHPGYFGDHVDHCVDMIRKVDSPNMKLLFDIYHVQIMDGDVIRRIGQLKDVTAHYHTAGVPGRGELDDTQELNYPAIMRAILATGYEGYVAQEFIPTWSDPVAALRHAAKLCDV
jgi:hydroxypyruvate isomerase